MTFKSNLHSLTLVLLASASTLALAQGVHLGGGAVVGGSGAIASPLQHAAMPALAVTPATPAVVESSAGGMAADGAKPDARTGAAADASVKADGNLAPNRGHKKLRKSQGHSMSGDANASVNGGAAARTGQ